MLKKPLKTHFNCKNCTRTARVSFANDVKLCFGLVKKVYKPNDFYRYCLHRGKDISKSDIMYEEALAIIMGISHILTDKAVIDSKLKYEKRKKK